MAEQNDQNTANRSNQGSRGGENDREKPLTTPATGPQGQDAKTGNQNADRNNQGSNQARRPGDNTGFGGTKPNPDAAAGSQEGAKKGQQADNDDTEDGPDIVVNPNKSKTAAGANPGAANRSSGNTGPGGGNAGGNAPGNR